MLYAWLTNPFTQPDFWSVSEQIFFLLLASCVIILLVNIQNIRNIFHSKIWNHFVYWQLAIVPFLLSPFCGLLIFLAAVIFLILRSIDLFCSFFHLPYFYVRVLQFNTLISIGFALFLPGYVSLLPFIYFISGLVCALLNRQLENVLINLSLALFGSIWIIYPSIHFLLISAMNEGLQKLIILGVAVAASDFWSFLFTQIYLASSSQDNTGRLSFYNKKLMLIALIGNIFGAFIGVNLLKFIEPDLPVNKVWILGLIVGVCTYLGLALFNLMRRYIEMKDFVYFSTKPSGVLDRMSLFMISAVVCYQYLILSAT